MEQINETMVKEIQNMFPDESIYDVIHLLKQMKKIIPMESGKEKIAYLEEIILYVDGLLNGDVISQYGTYTGLSKFARDAFQNILLDVQKQTIASYKKEKASLENEISTLSNTRTLLQEDVSNYQKKKEDLQTQTTAVSLELLTLKKELDDLRVNGRNRIRTELNEKKKEADKEIATLQTEKENLANASKELKALLQNYNETILNLGKDEKIVTWVPVKENDPIYNTNATTIDGYIASLKLQYQEIMHVDAETCEKEFQKNCPGLEEFQNHLKKFDCSSVAAIFNHSNWDKSQFDKDQLRAALNILRFPTYSPKTVNIDIQSLNTDTIPNNVNLLLRELYLQRIAMEAVAKQRILETELESLVGILKSIAPESYDFSPLIEMYGAIDPALSRILSNSDVLPLTIDSDKTKL